MEEVAFLRQNMVRDWTTSEDIFCLQTVWDEDAPSSFSWVYVAYGLCAREREREGVYAAKRSAYVGCFSKHYVPCFWFHLLQIPTTWWEVRKHQLQCPQFYSISGQQLGEISQGPYSIIYIDRGCQGTAFFDAQCQRSYPLVQFSCGGWFQMENVGNFWGSRLNLYHHVPTIYGLYRA